MNSYTIRPVPWTCEWGRFGVAVEDLVPAGHASTMCSGRAIARAGRRVSG